VIVSRLLIVDDEQSICWGLRQLGESMGHDVVTTASAEQALNSICEQTPDAIVLDVRLPGMDGLTAISQFREQLGDVPIIVITAHGDLDTAVRAIRNGAFEYLIKPFQLDQVQKTLTRALSAGTRGSVRATPAERVDGMVGSSAALQEVFKRIALAAESDACVLLCGESGTGKELAARAIHKYSSRANGPFVAVNVASLSPALAESELFGHVRGAFTGADESRTGLLAQADGGTLFLDEVAEIPLPVQVKLLRVLEHGDVTPVGSNHPVTSDFRVVSATHRDLMKQVASGDFRHDLFFRLCGFKIDLPALRERVEDICDLARHFAAGSAGRSAPEIPDETLTELQRRPWYGNIRELRNAIEHAAILARGGAIAREHLPPPADPFPTAAGQFIADPQRQVPELIKQWAETELKQRDEPSRLYDALLSLVEPPLFHAAMEKSGGQCAAAARYLGLHRTTLRKKLDQYDIES
jgi:two-component system nitrogen regulation response regulator GlnG